MMRKSATNILRNEQLEIHVDQPTSNYNFSRFDWTGKIADVRFRGISLSATERPDGENPDLFGRGFCNEFGIDSALGYEEAEIGGWFHKIGVGLLKKTEGPYQFHKAYEIIPARFSCKIEADKLVMTCTPDPAVGYSYILSKEIALLDNGFAIRYNLENTGSKRIRTDEYVHNFTAINSEAMGSSYRLSFPFDLIPDRFDERVNPGEKAVLGAHDISFSGQPEDQFFFSNLSGGKRVRAEWELINTKAKLGIRESGSFETDKINLWGWKHVISPELFMKIDLEPGQSAQWERKYEVFELAGNNGRHKTFETERLLLRPTSEEDAAFILELLNSPKWLRYIGDRNVQTVESAREYIRERMLPQLQKLGYSNYTVIRKSDGVKMGTCGLYDREGLEGIDLGYAFLPEHERQGYALESARLLTHAAFEEFGIRELFAITTEENRSSRNLLEKLGMKPDGPISIPGDDEELLLYRLKRKDDVLA